MRQRGVDMLYLSFAFVVHCGWKMCQHDDVRLADRGERWGDVQLACRFGCHFLLLRGHVSSTSTGRWQLGSSFLSKFCAQDA